MPELVSRKDPHSSLSTQQIPSKPLQLSHLPIRCLHLPQILRISHNRAKVNRHMPDHLAPPDTHDVVDLDYFRRADGSEVRQRRFPLLIAGLELLVYVLVIYQCNA